MGPKVSVIMPAYNSENYIEQAIRSVLEQTEHSFELIVVDDCSTDSTVDIVKGFKEKRIKLFQNTQNLGPAYSRNIALKAAQGEWITFLDSDDWFSPFRLERLLSVVAKRDIELVADDMYLIRDGASRPWRTALPDYVKSGDIINAKRFLEMECGFQPMISRNFLHKNNLLFNEKLRTGEDYMFILDCLLLGGRIAVVAEPHYFYRSRPDSLTTKKLNVWEQRYENLNNLLNKESIKKNEDLFQALTAQLIKVERSIQFYRVVAPLKKGHILIALKEFMRNPRFLILFISYFPKILRNRFLYHFKTGAAQNS